MNTDPTRLAAEVRITRRKFGLSIPDLGEALDVDARAINRWEGGQVAPPTGVIEALRALDIRMQRRLIQRIAQLKTSGATTIPFYRDRAELVAAEPFYLHLPSSLYEWEVAQLVDRLNVTATYTAQWRQAHPHRGPHQPATRVLEVTADGTFALPHTSRVPASLVAIMPQVLPALGAADPQRTLAFAPRVPLTSLLDVKEDLEASGQGAIALTQPWDNAPTLEQILARSRDEDVTVDMYVVADDTTLTLELAGIHDSTDSDTWADTPTDRAPWL